MLITLEDIAKEMEKSDQRLAAIQAKLARLAEIDREARKAAFDVI